MGASPQMVDWDEDGDKDLLVGEYDGHVHYFQNIGTATNPVLHAMGHLQAGGVDIDVSQLAIPVVNDWDEDGRKDLIVGNDLANIKVFMNTGTNARPVLAASYNLVTNPAITQIKNAPDIGDLNGDGLKDLVFGWWQGTVVYYPNSGTNAAPVFNEVHTLTALGTVIDPNDPSGGWTHLELNDWDEDGDLDLLYGEWSGTIYVHLNVTGDVTAAVTPVNPPIVIPHSGGSFSFNVSAHNEAANPAHVHVWTMMRLEPSGPWMGPYLNASATVASGATISRTRTQNVPGSLEPGTYTYQVRIGDYPNDIWYQSGFTFAISPVGDGPWVGNFDNYGESFDDLTIDNPVSTPDNFVVSGVYPNPFNPSTVIRFNLPNAALVQLDVFDTNGRLVRAQHAAPLQAGEHNITFDGAGLPSGVYTYKLTAGEQAASGKMVLMK
ncbi:MAG: T9SS type A sorting domain-containing protein [bacterium]|nr:T9SS type A sorting domain-containing protein [bacterium]